jgi:serine/threonine protein kinase
MTMPAWIAIKVIDKSYIVDEPNRERLAQEISILTKMNHPFIAKLLFVSDEEDHVELGQELAPHGNFTEFLAQTGELPEDQIRYYFMQLVSVLEYLHNERKVAHRDLKLENILLDYYDNIKVIDFGLSHEFENANDLFTTPCGSCPYISPELIVTGRQGVPADIWSLGMILYACATARLPFRNDNFQMLYRQILSAEIYYPMNLSDELTDLLKKMLCRDPHRRITIEEIKQHPWFPTERYAALQRAVKAWARDSNSSIQNDSETIALMAAGGIKYSGTQQGELSEMSLLYDVYNCQIRGGRMNRALREPPGPEKSLTIQNSIPRLRAVCGGQPLRRESCHGTERVNTICRMRRIDQRHPPCVDIQRRLRRPGITPIFAPILHLEPISDLVEADECANQ